MLGIQHLGQGDVAQLPAVRTNHGDVRKRGSAGTAAEPLLMSQLTADNAAVTRQTVAWRRETRLLEYLMHPLP